LHPLEEPLAVDLGLHRWLKAEREEAYSDWLQWVIEQVKQPRQVCRIFGLPLPPDIAEWQNLPLHTCREDPVPLGHPGHEGRLDLLIRYGSKLLIVVEVKKVGADEADTAKQAGYERSLSAFQTERIERVLLAVHADTQESYGRFRFVSWAEVCIRLRQVASRFTKENRVMVAAMLVAFVAAVEQNLLGFSAALVRNVRHHQPVPVDPRVVDHLNNYLALEE
jgi:hypothetical protein